MVSYLLNNLGFFPFLQRYRKRVLEMSKEAIAHQSFRKAITTQKRRGRLRQEKLESNIQQTQRASHRLANIPAPNIALSPRRRRQQVNPSQRLVVAVPSIVRSLKRKLKQTQEKRDQLLEAGHGKGPCDGVGGAVKRWQKTQ